jgi:LL-diaminopimelate aminotransferase
VAPPGYYERLVAFARRYDIAVIHDNAYCELAFDGLVCGSFLQAEGAAEVGIELYSLSKTYNFAGARVGFAAGNARMVKLLRALKSNFDFGTFLPIQLAAEAALSGPQESVAETRDTYQRRRDALVRGLAEAGWEIPKPRATMFVWAPIPAGWPSAEAFARAFAERGGVIVVPGTAFGPAGEGHVRMALVQPEEVMAQVAQRFAHCAWGGGGPCS